MNDYYGISIIKAEVSKGALYAEFEIQQSAGNAADVKLWRLQIVGFNSFLAEGRNEKPQRCGEYEVTQRLAEVLQTAYSLHEPTPDEFLAYVRGWSVGYQKALQNFDY